MRFKAGAALVLFVEHFAGDKTLKAVGEDLNF